jgi:RNA polymerase sigma factor (sigma-70 family)
MPTDAELLHRYLHHDDEGAFSELVQRHVGVVYASALRRTDGRARLAEEITQQVFSSLARHARHLADHPALIGWLFRCTHNAARDALRSEYRREKLTRSLTAMPDETTPPDIDTESLRKFLDQALDQLKSPDRDVLLLRFFNGMSFAAIGTHFHVDENTARMRANRALEKLRQQLARQGFTSTAAALALALNASAMASAPAGLATTVSTAALASVPAGGVPVITSFLLMTKITVPAVSAIIAAGVVSSLWHHKAQAAIAPELQRLRNENVRLTQLVKTNDLSRRAAHLAQAITQNHSSFSATRSSDAAPSSTAANRTAGMNSTSGRPDSPRGHHWAGQATAEDAGRSFAWACDTTDVDALANLLYFDPDQRERARAVLATMPASIQAGYPTPEKFYAFVIAADALAYPPPLPETFAQFHAVELQSGRVAFRRSGSSHNFQEYQQTADGWKFVVPARGVELWPANLANETLANLPAR